MEKSARLRGAQLRSVTVVTSLEGDGESFATAMRPVTWVFGDEGCLIAVDDPNLENAITVSNSKFARPAHK